MTHNKLLSLRYEIDVIHTIMLWKYVLKRTRVGWSIVLLDV